MLELEVTYHIYNRSNGNEDLFYEPRNYQFFMRKYLKYLSPVAETYAWYLLKNHFHAMICVRSEQEIITNLNTADPTTINISTKIKNQFKNFLISYAKAFNKTYNRTGSLFSPNMKKKEISNDIYFTQLILYIHNNAVKHEFVNNLYDWPYCSIHSYLAYIARREKNQDFQSFENFGSEANIFLNAINPEPVMDWFGGTREFMEAHRDIQINRSMFD